MMDNDDTASVIRAALEADSAIDLRRYPIQVRVDNAVHLEGEVKDIIAKRKATRIAHLCAGSAGIEDRLRISTAEQISGDSLCNAALKALVREPAFADMDIYVGEDLAPGQEQDWIRVGAVGCILRLSGEVRSLSHRRLAEVIAWWVPGCCDVDNHLHVRPVEQDNDEEISDALRLVFDKEPTLDAEQISAVTRNREITLRGAVHSEEQKRRAEQNCWYIPGVHAVHNLLQVVSRSMP
jgi:osmotically-inducible protein OsmY